MSVNDFLKLPIVKLTAMAVMLFYIFDKTKDDPRTISYHMKKENISKSIDVVNKNITNISAIKNQIQNKESNQNFDDNKKIELIYQDIRQGIGGKEAKCGSEVFVEYSFINKNNGDVINKSNMKFEIGSRFNEIIERTIIGMSAGGIRVVDIPKNFKIGDSHYDEMVQNSQMIYKILLLTISEEDKPNAICYE